MSLVQRLHRRAALGAALPFIVLTATSVAQTQNWVRQFGTPKEDLASALAPDGSGGVYVAGLMNAGDRAGSQPGTDEVWLARYDAAGGRIWIQQTGHLTVNSRPSAASDGAGGVFLIGGGGAWIEHYGGTGIRAWIRQPVAAASQAHGATSDGAGGVIVCGETWAGGIDAWITRYDGAGNLVWLRQFGTVVDEEWASAVAPDGSGGAFVTVHVTYVDPTNPWQPLGHDLLLVRYDALGNQLWITPDVTVSGRMPIFPDAASDGAGGVFLSGSVYRELDGEWESNAVLMHYDGAGNRTWVQQFGTAEDDWVNGLAPDGAGGVYMAGQTSGELGGPYVGGDFGDAWLARYDAAGHRLWIQQFGTESSESASAVTPDGSGRVYVAGSTRGDFGAPNAGDSDVWLALHDGDGTVRYCSPTVPNLAGRFGEMGATGSRITQQNDFGLIAYRLPEQSFGYFITSRERGLVVRPDGSRGDLCLGGQIGRFSGAGQVLNSGAGGAFSLEIDLTSMPMASGPAKVVSGETWIFQAWYRDRGEDPTRTSNFTDALAVTFR